MKKYLTRHHLLRLTTVVLALCGTLLFIQLFAHTSFKYQSLSFDLRTQISAKGGTAVVIPPVGQLFVKTHLMPWQIVVTLDEVDFVKLGKQLDSLPPQTAWLKILRQEVIRALLTLFSLVFACGLLGGILTLLALKVYPSSRFFWFNLGGSFLLLVILIGGTVLTYEPRSLERPEYQGVLASAPWAMNLVTMGLDNIEVIGANLKKISKELPMLYKQAGQIKNMGDMQTDLAVLHVSDIHNNPAAFDFITELVSNFKVQFIIDTGDLTDYGTPLEAKLVERFKEIKVPYLFIPGNHDTPLIVKYLQKLKRVKVLTEGTISINGLKITSLRDPAATSFSSEVALPWQMDQANQKLRQMLASLKEEPDIVAVHNLELTKGLAGMVPLILHGHDHQYKLSTELKTVIDDAGTTGAAGIRGLTKNGVPYSASILYWKKDVSGRLLLYAIDSIKINGMQGQLTIDRHTF